jgi:glycine/D-amino acid oxidase-like deaminating enzyme
MTRKLDLHTGSPVWRAYRAPGPAAEPLARDVKADVAIVGMGISAAMTADALSDAGRSVILIDRRGPMLGSTAATTALVQHEIDQPLSTLSRRIGQDRAERA